MISHCRAPIGVYSNLVQKMYSPRIGSEERKLVPVALERFHQITELFSLRTSFPILLGVDRERNFCFFPSSKGKPNVWRLMVLHTTFFDNTLLLILILIVALLQHQLTHLTIHQPHLYQLPYRN